MRSVKLKEEVFNTSSHLGQAKALLTTLLLVETTFDGLSALSKERLGK